MTKHFFTKYLPVEGEIKKGDKLIDPTLPSLGVSEALTDNEGAKIASRGGKKVKLSLCSRDIQVGDWAQETPDVLYKIDDIKYEFLIHERGTLHRDIAYKVIGEVSPEATWVKEGMEFDEYEEWWWNPLLGTGTMIMKKLKEEWDDVFSKHPEITSVIKLKCSQCNTFH